VSAKVERKAAVDFLGAYRGRPLAFDAKDCSEDRIPFAGKSGVQPHQAEFLDVWMLQNPGGLSFILAGHMSTDLYVVPWIYWRASMAAHKRGGPASAHFRDFECYKVRGKDYLTKVDEFWGIFTGEEANEVDATTQERVDNIRDLIKTQAGQLSKGEDPSYSLGLYNGMEMALSIIEGRDPRYKSREVINNEHDLQIRVPGSNALCV
jgi:recombination protein U